MKLNLEDVEELVKKRIAEGKSIEAGLYKIDGKYFVIDMVDDGKGGGDKPVITSFEEVLTLGNLTADD